MSAGNLPDLAGALRRSPLAPAKTPEPVSRAVKTEKPETPRPQRAVSPRQKRPIPAGEQGRDVVWRRSVGFSMPRDVRAAATQQARSDDSTLTAWLLTALNRHHRNLENRLNQDTGDGGELFAVPQSQIPQPKVQSTMRVTDEQYDAMERLARQLNTTRSGLLTAAAEAELADHAADVD